MNDASTTTKKGTGNFSHFTQCVPIGSTCTVGNGGSTKVFMLFSDGWQEVQQMDIISYALSKKIAEHAVSGVQSMSVSGQTLTINTKDSGVLTMTFPTPKDGVSVINIGVNANNQIVFTMSDGSEIISGKIPTVKGDKGDPFKYSDFTQEQLDALKGADGDTPNFTIGTVETLPSGSDATASITGSAENPVLNLGIPKGADGKGSGTSESTVDVLEGKKILFIGDSICYGTGLSNGQYPYPYWIGQLHPTATIINDGVAGSTICYQDSASGDSIGLKCQNDRYGGSEFADADIVVIEGGINDLMRNKTFGTLKSGYMNIRQKYYKDDITTYAGALEYIFKYFTEKFVGKRILFTTIHRLTSAIAIDKQWAYWECASEACAKWGVEFIDLFHSIPTELTGSDLHPNNATHKDWYARIINDVLVGNRAFAVSTNKTYYGKFVTTMSALITTGYTTNVFKVGDTFSQSDWRINSGGFNGASGANVTSKITWDLSDIPMDSNKVLTTQGTYYAHGWANIDGVFMDCAVPVTVNEAGSEGGGGEETTAELTGIGATKSKTTYTVGETLNTDDITVTGTYSDGSTKDLTSEASIDTSGVNMDADGVYVINVSVDGGYTATISITVSTSVTDTTTWDDSTTITSAWRTEEGVFENIAITNRYTSDTIYNVSCKLLVESDSATSGQVVLRVGGATSDLGTITFGQTINVNVQMTANANWTTNNIQVNVYTTGGSGFPWTVYIKDFVITEDDGGAIDSDAIIVPQTGTWQLKTTTGKKYIILGTDDDNNGNAKYFRLLRTYGFPYTMNVEAENASIAKALGNDVDDTIFTDGDAPALFPDGVDVITLGKYLHDNNLGEVAQHGASSSTLWDSEKLTGDFLTSLHTSYVEQGGTKTEEELRIAIMEQLADTDVSQDAVYVDNSRTNLENKLGFPIYTVGLWGGAPIVTIDGIECNLNSIKGSSNYNWRAKNYTAAGTLVGQFGINKSTYDLARVACGVDEVAGYIERIEADKVCEFFWHMPFNDEPDVSKWRTLFDYIKGLVDTGKVEVVTRKQYAELGEYVDNPITKIVISRDNIPVGETDLDGAYTITATYADNTTANVTAEAILDRSDVNVEETGIYTVSATYRGFNATATVSVINTNYTIPDGLKDTSYWFIAKNETQNKLIASNTTGKFGTAGNYSGILKLSGCTGGKMNGWVSTDDGATWTQVNKNDSHYGTVGTNGTTITENTTNGVPLNFAHAANDVITFLETSGNFEITYGS